MLLQTLSILWHMCGIVGFVRSEKVVADVLAGLARLEYRGYDSAGIGVQADGGVGGQVKKRTVCVRAVGALDVLRQAVPAGLDGYVAIGHTRWATHGPATLDNTHPHVFGPLTMVHNGIFENAGALRQELIHGGHTFQGETDTEVAVHWLGALYVALQADKVSSEHGRIKAEQDREKGAGPLEEKCAPMHDICHETQAASDHTVCDRWIKAFSQAFASLHGHFAVLGMVETCPGTLWVARRGTPPLVLGKFPDGYGISSDLLGFAQAPESIAYVPDNHWALIQRDNVRLWTFDGAPVPWDLQPCPPYVASTAAATSGHRMWDEMQEQPALLSALALRGTPSLQELAGGKTPAHVTFLGCGTSFYAGAAAQSFFERVCPVKVELASEFHYRHPRMAPGLTIALSQSGETADTLQAATYAQKQGQILTALVNVPHSALARMADHVLDTQAGPELSVASTKSFMTQLWTLGACAGVLTSDMHEGIAQAVQAGLDTRQDLRPLVDALAQAGRGLFLGRGICYPLAQEGALKIKELAYIQAEAMPAGELKHGPLALIQDDLPVLFIAPHDAAFARTAANMCEVLARRGQVHLLTDPKGAEAWHKEGGSHGLASQIIVPLDPQICDTPMVPFAMAAALQVLAYQAALVLDRPIDRPRHLAKSVTVE